jgi:hypothetical protein
MKKLTLQDILDLRAYERMRDEFRSEVMKVKANRRIQVGPIVSVLFENPQTVKFQIQEMARAERMITDEQILNELEIYNKLLPEDGWLSATVFLELTTKQELKEWLPKLVGIENSFKLIIGAKDSIEVIYGQPEKEHAETLTRQDVTSSVHYILFDVGVNRVEDFKKGPVFLVVDHANYSHTAELKAQSLQEIAKDLVNS